MVKSNRKIIGILGGMGPEASADLYLRIIKICQEKYRAKHDSDYPHIIINSITPPDVVGKGSSLKREEVIKKMKEETLPHLVKGVKTLERGGADFILIACNTVQYFVPTLRKCVKISVISLPEEVAKILKKFKIKKTGILATTNTVKMKIYEKELKKFGTKLIKPSLGQQNEINEIILRLMEGKRKTEDKEFLCDVMSKLVSKGAEAIILGCTELPLIISKEDYKVLSLDTTEILAQKAVEIAFGDKNSHP